MNVLGYRAFATELLKIATEVRDADIRAMMAEARGKEYLNGGALRTNSEAETNFKPKLAAPNSTAFTPVGAFNVQGKKPTPANTPYETISNFAGTGLRGAMTGGSAAMLGHTIHTGTWDKMNPRHLGLAVAGGTGIALADRALRRRAMKKHLTKTAMTAFTPARQLHATQSRGDFENKVHKTPLTTPATTIGRDFRLPPQGA